MNYEGYIQNTGNDLGIGIWERPLPSGGQLCGSFTLSKSPRDIPTTEVTIAKGFGSGSYATVGQFRQILVHASGSTKIMKGRQVSERTGGGLNYDDCNFPGSVVPKWEQVVGSLWNVGYYSGLDNYWVDDYIGWNTSQVDCYRIRLTPDSFPCEAKIPQIMDIGVNGNSGNRQMYKSHSIGSKINLDKVTTNRDGVTQTTTY